jgi:hypothetical protein
MADRTPRDLETRSAEMRAPAWAPANSLPDPNPRPGKKFRWIRTSAGGQSDAINVARRLREGYVPVKAVDYPELQILSDKDSRFPDSVEVGGLLLCSTSEEQIRARNEYYRAQTKNQMQAVDSQLMAEQDPRLRTLYRNVKSQTRFGPDARRETGAGAQLPTNQK